MKQVVAVGRIKQGEIVIERVASSLLEGPDDRRKPVLFLMEHSPTLYDFHRDHDLSMAVDDGNTFIHCRTCWSLVYTGRSAP